jgi:hypothetical protein
LFYNFIGETASEGSIGMEMRATILHADLDAFYASVEQLLDPSLRGRPIAVINGHQLKLKAGTMVLIEAAIGTRSAIPTGRFCKR